MDEDGKVVDDAHKQAKNDRANQQWQHKPSALVNIINH